jgi:hypothetical protein
MVKLLVAVSMNGRIACVIEVSGRDSAAEVAYVDDSLDATELSRHDECGIYVWEGEFDRERPEKKRWSEGKWRFPNAEELARIGEGRPLW